MENNHLLINDIINNYFQNKEIIRCLKCNMISNIHINPKNNTIFYCCPYHKNTCNYSIFLFNCSKKCPNCFQPIHNSKLNSSDICNHCNKNINEYNNNKCKQHQKYFIDFCKSCKNYLCDECFKSHKCSQNNMVNLSDYCLNKNSEEFIENNLKKKENILNNIIKYIENIPNDNKYKGKGNQLLILLEEKKKELFIENLIYMNYKEYKHNNNIIINAEKVLKLEKEYFPKIDSLNLNILYNDDNFGKHLNYIRSYIQNDYQQVNINSEKYCLQNYKNNNNLKDNNVYQIHDKNIKSICVLTESLIISGSWDNTLKIFNLYINQVVYSIDAPSMIFNLKKYPLIHTKKDNDINMHGILVCLYCELLILNIQEKNSQILDHSTIASIKGFGNFIWTTIILDPDKKIISASLDKRLSAHKLLPNDRNKNEDINYCLINSNMNKQKETITSLLQIDEHNFVSSSSLDLNEDPSIKFWSYDNNDNFIMDKCIYDVYCCQYPNSICRINNNILGFCLEYASLMGIIGGIALVDIRYKEIVMKVNMLSISCIASKYENHFFACGFDKINKKRYIKEFNLNEEIKEIESLELFELNDDIINIEFIDESDLMVIGCDDGKISIFDNYSKFINIKI